MAIFFFVVGLEIKLELRQGSLSSLKKALLPCIAAVGGMITPMLVYLATLPLLGGGSLAALTVPMATDIAFAMAIFGFFRTRMPASSSVFLLTLATVDDLGAIFVLATCFAKASETSAARARGRPETESAALVLVLSCFVSSGALYRSPRVSARATPPPRPRLRALTASRALRRPPPPSLARGRTCASRSSAARPRSRSGSRGSARGARTT